MSQLSIKDGKPKWVPARRRDMEPDPKADMEELARHHELLVTESVWLEPAEKDPTMWKNSSLIKVWARMSPQGKASLIRELNNQGRQTLMCGDGGNDVGALKAASVGIALLSGFGNSNTKEDPDLMDMYPNDPETALEKLEERIQMKAKLAGGKAKNKNLAKRNEV